MPVHIDPADCIAFTKIHGEFVTSHWADVGIVPYRISANLYCFTNFDRKADSPRPSTLFSFLFSLAREKTGPPEAYPAAEYAKNPLSAKGIFLYSYYIKESAPSPLENYPQLCYD